MNSLAQLVFVGLEGVFLKGFVDNLIGMQVLLTSLLFISLVLLRFCSLKRSLLTIH